MKGEVGFQKKNCKPKSDFSIFLFISFSWNKRHTPKRNFWYKKQKKNKEKLALKIAKFPTYLVAGTVRDLVNHCKR